MTTRETFNPMQFVAKVRDMRKAQQSYFKTRSPLYLQRSKELEKEVDAICTIMLNPEPEPKGPDQQSLF